MLRKWLIAAAAIVALAGAGVSPSLAAPCTPTTVPNTAGVTQNSVLELLESICSNASAVSVAGFQGSGIFTPLTATGSTSASTALPTGTVTDIHNTGTTAVSCVEATGAATGLVNKLVIQPGAHVSRVNGAFDHIACIDQGGADSTSNVVVLEGGSGLGNDSGGGGGGGSGGSVTQGTSPWVDNITTWAGGTLGAMTNFGTTPGAVLVPGVNASIIGTVIVNGSGVTQPVSVAANQIVDGGDVTLGSKADAACAGSGSACSVDARLAHLEALGAGSIPGGSNTIGAVNQVSQYPVGAVIYSASATGTTAATTATLANAATGTTTFLCGLSIRANATAAATGNATVTGTLSGTMNFTQWTAPNASGLGVTEMIFTPCFPASATNTPIAVVSAAPGTGGVVSVTAWGYKL